MRGWRSRPTANKTRGTSIAGPAAHALDLRRGAAAVVEPDCVADLRGFEVAWVQSQRQRSSKANGGGSHETSPFLADRRAQRPLSTNAADAPPHLSANGALALLRNAAGDAHGCHPPRLGHCHRLAAHQASVEKDLRYLRRLPCTFAAHTKQNSEGELAAEALLRLANFATD